MLNRLLVVLSLISVFAGELSAQKVQLGFQIESNGIKASHGSELEPFTGSILGFQLNASVYPIDNNLALEVRAATMGEISFFSGEEFGLLAKYFVLKPAYLIGGIIWHKIESDGHFGYYVYGSNLRMPAFGIGVNPLGSLNFEVMYLYTGDIEAGQYFDSLNEPGLPVNLKYALKFGIGFQFDLISWKY